MERELSVHKLSANKRLNTKERKKEEEEEGISHLADLPAHVKYVVSSLLC